MKKIETCNICGHKELIYDEESALCPVCNILYNLKTKPLCYINGGGQNEPNNDKSLLRLKNAFQRFEIILPFKNNHNTFVDIGCGSGEMLEASKNFFDYHLGYDQNRLMIKYTKKNGLNTRNKNFEKKDLIDRNSGVVLSINHVLEHVEKPMEMLKSIKSNLENDDLIYIEVPLWTGISFKRKKYGWSLWYDEHLALYSLRTLRYLAETLDMNVIDIGTRNFISDSMNKKVILINILRDPLKFLASLLTKKKYHKILDNYFKDFGFVLLEKKKHND